MTVSSAKVDVAPVLAAVAADTSRLIDQHLAGREPGAWLWDLARDYPSRGGKAIRPALLVASCRAFGGHTEDALVSAAAIELLHNAFLVHDDIQDSSLLRRGQPTLHESVGVPLALNAGDALVMAGLEMLTENRARLGSRVASHVAREFEVMLQHTLEGQAIELGWQRDVVVDLDSDDYLDLIMRKTCWYTTIHPLRTGMLIGTLGRDVSPDMVHFGFCLGAAFQIQDDLLNLTGDEATYGKEILGDLYEGKRTLMLIHLLRHVSDSERQDIIASFLARPRSERTQDQVRHVVGLMHRYGSIDFAQEFAEGIRGSAFESFDAAFESAHSSDDLAFLRAMVDFMLDRTS